MFEDRRQAGKQLAAALDFLKKDKNVIVLAIPRGGVVVAKEVADRLGAPLDLIITHKLGAPGNPELAVGAVTQDGESIEDEELVRTLGVSNEYLRQESARQSSEIRRRLASYRGGRPSPRLEGKTVVIVDDGIATGSTVRAAIGSVKRMGARSVVLAVPVGPSEAIAELARRVDRVVCLSSPEPFYAIGEFYRRFDQVDDETVKSILAGSRLGD